MKLIDKLTYSLGILLCMTAIFTALILFGAIFVTTILSFSVPFVILGLGVILINKHI